MKLFISTHQRRIEKTIRDLEIKQVKLKMQMCDIQVSTNPVQYFKLDVEVNHLQLQINILRSIL